MLTEDQKRYLKTLPSDKRVKIYPFNKRVSRTAEKIIRRIANVCPDLKIVHMGASALGISGQNDLDIYVLSEPRDFEKYLPELIKLFGEPKSKHETFIGWEFVKDGYAVELYLTDPGSTLMKQQIAVFEILNNDRELLSEYKKLKEDMNGKSFREYQRKKYEFFNIILAKKQ